MLEWHLKFAKYHVSSFCKANEIEISLVEKLGESYLPVFFHAVLKTSCFGGWLKM